MARVCGASPAAYANTSGAVVDANFSTFWAVGADPLELPALVALLHSSWVRANLEVSCTVLGGGALKVEAADLRRLALPELNHEQRASLASFGTRLMTGERAGETERAIDLVVVDALGAHEARAAAMALSQLVDDRLMHRTAR